MSTQLIGQTVIGTETISNIDVDAAPDHFDHAIAFGRNIGWVTAEELERLRCSRIAIAGLGGVGGRHLLTHVRLGVGAFSLAEFDRFEQVNFNRQAKSIVCSISSRVSVGNPSMKNP